MCGMLERRKKYVVRNRRSGLDPTGALSPLPPFALLPCCCFDDIRAEEQIRYCPEADRRRTVLCSRQ